MRRQFPAPAPLAVGLAIGLAAASAGCTTDKPSRAGPTPAVSASPTPEATPESRASQIREWVLAAGLAASVVGAREPENEEEAASPKTVCEIPSATSPHKVASHSWDWSGTKIDNVVHSAYGFEPEPGRAMVAELRTNVKKCTTVYDWGGIWDMKIVGEHSVTRPAGIDDAFGFCEHGKVKSGSNDGTQAYLCYAFLSRDAVAIELQVLELGLADAKAGLNKVIPVAAAALVRAVPDS
jgi:hypothetical protein